MDNLSDDRTLLIKNKIDELSKVPSFLEELIREWGLTDAILFNLNLAIEEALSNTILYGYNDSNDHFIELSIKIENRQITVIIEDDAVEFDPTTLNDPEIFQPAEKRTVGGLGVFLIKKLMDNVKYKRVDKKNILTLTKFF